MVGPSKRLFAVLAGALGLRALLRRHSAAAPAADDLRAKLAESRTVEADRADFEAGETPVDEAPAVDTRAVEPPAVETRAVETRAVETRAVETRRAEAHARARAAIDDLGE